MSSHSPQPLSGAPNIGKTIRRHLEHIGVYSLADLARVTPAKAYLAICAGHPGKTFALCYYLYSLQASLLGVHWNALTEYLKTDLRRQVGREKRPTVKRKNKKAVVTDGSFKKRVKFS